MKKIILNSLLGVMLCGSAFAAAPTLEDRIETCLKHSDKYVWVDKYQTCVPINPCTAKSQQIRESYCVTAIKELPAGNAERIINKYVEHVLNTYITEKTDVFSESDGRRSNFYLLENIGNVATREPLYISAKLGDGGYVTFEFTDGTYLLSDFDKQDAETFSCWAHGYIYNDNKNVCKNVKNNTTCTDIADFASVLLDSLCSGEFDESRNCKLVCEEGGASGDVRWNKDARNIGKVTADECEFMCADGEAPEWCDC